MLQCLDNTVFVKQNSSNYLDVKPFADNGYELHFHRSWVKDIYVICRPGGPYWEKLCPRSWVRPEAAGRGPCSRPRAQFFPIRTDLGRQITCLFFSLWKITLAVSHTCSSFTPCACVWRFGQVNPCCLLKYLKEEIQFSLILNWAINGLPFMEIFYCSKKLLK